MASGFSSFLNNKVLDFVFSGTQTVVPTKYWALFKSDAGLVDNDTSKWVEVTGTGYARVQADNVSFSTASASSVTNVLEVQFPVAESDWGVITHVGIMDAATGGNCLAYAQFMDATGATPRPKTVYTADQMVIRARGSNFTLYATTA